MGKLFLFKFLLIEILFGQSTFKNNVVIQKVTPVIYLNGTGARIDFYYGDVAPVLTSNVLTVDGGDLKVATPDNTTMSALTTNGSQTLTNKTLTSPKVIEDVALTASIGTTDYFIAANDATTAEKAVANVVCDGMADQVQINAALTAGCNVKLSSGQFNIAAPITAAVNNITIVGTGKEKTTIFLSNGANSNVITIGGNFWTIKDLLINANRASNTGTCNGIYGLSVLNVIIENCEIENVEDRAILIFRVSQNWDISRCYIHDVGGAIEGSSWGAAGAPSNIKVSYCDIYNTTVESQIHTLADPGLAGFNWNIDHCTFKGTTGYMGVLFDSTLNCNITNSYFNLDSAAGAGEPANVRYYEGSSGIISGNTFAGAGGTGDVGFTNINIWGGKDVTITGNYFTHLNSRRGSGIAVEAYSNGYDVNNINIEGNTFYNISTTPRVSQAIALYAATTYTVSRVNINGNTFMDDRGASAMCSYAVGASGAGTVKNVNISNNKIEGMLNYGIVLVATTIEDFKISNNIFKDVPIGINATDWSNIIINGNRFTNCEYPMNK